MNNHVCGSGIAAAAWRWRWRATRLERYAVDGDADAAGSVRARRCPRGVAERRRRAVEDMDIIVICLHPEAAAVFVRARPGASGRARAADGRCGVKRPLLRGRRRGWERTFIYLAATDGGARTAAALRTRRRICFAGRNCHPHGRTRGVPQESIRLMERLVTFMGCADVVFRPGGA